MFIVCTVYVSLFLLSLTEMSPEIETHFLFQDGFVQECLNAEWTTGLEFFVCLFLSFGFFGVFLGRGWEGLAGGNLI